MSHFRPTRRTVVTGAALAAVAPIMRPGILTAEAAAEPSEVDYVVVGSGPGGGPVAARLALAGYSVLVLEAGPAHGDDLYYTVPSLWPRTVSDPQIRWDYYVRHYSNAALHGGQFVPAKDGVLYPRAATIGGCTAHHAMVTITASPDDWRELQTITRDATFNPDQMWRHWESVKSWQPIEQVLPFRNIGDLQIDALFLAGLTDDTSLPPGAGIKWGVDPNSWANTKANGPGFFVSPQNSTKGKRVGPREFLLATAAQRSTLKILTDALAEKVIFQKTPGGAQKAVAVSYLAGRHVYQASPDARALTDSQRAALRRTVTVRKEVILAGGCFNSPQLLMLSGIGPASHLRSVGIEPLVDVPGVGGNFQDRHEATTVIELEKPFSSIDACALTGAADDVCLDRWKAGGNLAVYGSNGAPFYIRRPYSKGRPNRPEIALLGVFGEFYNFRPGWVDKALAKPSNHFTWIAVKAYTQSRSGTVRLRSADPTVTPLINKHSFNDGTGDTYDRGAVAEGIATARRINQRSGLRLWELAPGPTTDLDRYIVREQFGHHGSCTNPIGAANESMAVLDSKHRVRGTTGLRVVDASSFRNIPGSFLWAPVATMAERAAVEILKDA